jgi:hypothetical protein
MSSLEAYSPESFGNSACDGILPQHILPPRQNRPASTTEEALRRHGSLSEEEIRVALGKIEAAESWLGPIALGGGEAAA